MLPHFIFFRKIFSFNRINLFFEIFFHFFKSHFIDFGSTNFRDNNCFDDCSTRFFIVSESFKQKRLVRRLIVIRQTIFFDHLSDLISNSERHETFFLSNFTDLYHPNGNGFAVHDFSITRRIFNSMTNRMSKI